MDAAKDAAKQFCESCEQTLRILDWAYQGFNCSLTKAKSDNQKFCRLLTDIQAMEESDVCGTVLKHVNAMTITAKKSMRWSFRLPKSSLSAGMDKHLEHALNVFDDQIQRINSTVISDE